MTKGVSVASLVYIEIHMECTGEPIKWNACVRDCYSCMNKNEFAF